MTDLDSIAEVSAKVTIYRISRKFENDTNLARRSAYHKAIVTTEILGQGFAIDEKSMQKLLDDTFKYDVNIDYDDDKEDNINQIEQVKQMLAYEWRAQESLSFPQTTIKCVTMIIDGETVDVLITFMPRPNVVSASPPSPDPKETPQ